MHLWRSKVILKTVTIRKNSTHKFASPNMAHLVKAQAATKDSNKYTTNNKRSKNSINNDFTIENSYPFKDQTVKRSFLNHESYPEMNTDTIEDIGEYMRGQSSTMNEFEYLNGSTMTDESKQRLKLLCDNKDLSTYDLNNSKSSSSSYDSIERYIESQLTKAFKQLPPNYATPTLKHRDKNSFTIKSKNYIKLSAKDAINLINDRTYNLISIDNEFFERQNTKVTEIGISIYNPSYQKFTLYPHFLNFHFIIKEFINLRNGQFVPDSKMNNITGQSIVISKKDLPRAMNTIFHHLGPKSCIVGHNVAGDICSFKYLNYQLPTDLYVIDTVDLWLSLVTSNNIKSSLSYILDTLNVPNAFLHNGANDAYYTLVVCLLLSSPEIRNNLIFRKKKSVEDEIRKSAEIESEPYMTKQKPDFSDLSPKEAQVKEERWLRKQKKAAAKAEKSRSLPINSFDLIKVRCAVEDENIVKKHKGPLAQGSKRYQRNPAVNTFFQPVSYEERLLTDKLKELNV